MEEPTALRLEMTKRIEEESSKDDKILEKVKKSLNANSISLDLKRLIVLFSARMELEKNAPKKNMENAPKFILKRLSFLIQI